jgi:hypothetical protein
MRTSYSLTWDPLLRKALSAYPLRIAHRDRAPRAPFFPRSPSRTLADRASYRALTVGHRLPLAHTTVHPKRRSRCGRVRDRVRRPPRLSRASDRAPRHPGDCPGQWRERRWDQWSVRDSRDWQGSRGCWMSCGMSVQLWTGRYRYVVGVISVAVAVVCQGVSRGGRQDDGSGNSHVGGLGKRAPIGQPLGDVDSHGSRSSVDRGQQIGLIGSETICVCLAALSMLRIQDRG